MKEIKAIIQPFMLERVCAALREIEGLPGVTVSQVMGWGKTRAFDAREHGEGGAGSRSPARPRWSSSCRGRWHRGS